MLLKTELVIATLLTVAAAANVCNKKVSVTFASSSTIGSTPTSSASGNADSVTQSVTSTAHQGSTQTTQTSSLIGSSTPTSSVSGSADSVTQSVTSTAHQGSTQTTQASSLTSSTAELPEPTQTAIPVAQDAILYEVYNQEPGVNQCSSPLQQYTMRTAWGCVGESAAQMIGGIRPITAPQAGCTFSVFRDNHCAHLVAAYSQDELMFGDCINVNAPHGIGSYLLEC